MNMLKKNFLVLLIILVGFSVRVYATSWTYPSAAPCNTTLQACINGVQSGDTIFIAQAKVDEDLTINKSVNMLPFPPNPSATIGGGNTTRTISVVSGPNEVHVKLIQLKLQNSRIESTFTNGGNYLTVLDSTIDLNQKGLNAITLNSNTTNGFSFLRNLIKSSGFGIYADMNGTLDPESETGIDIKANTFTSSDTSLSQGAIRIKVRGVGYIGTNINNNIIYNVTGCGSCGAQAAIDVSVGDTAQAGTILENNTIDSIGLGDGIWLETPDAGTVVMMQIYNNIVTNISNAWLHLPPFSANVQINQDANTDFNAAAAYGGYAPGPDTYYQDPGYTNGPQHDYSLTPFSPCLDTGLINNVNIWSPRIDWAQTPRPLGKIIDRGALERTSSVLVNYLYLADNFNDGVLNNNYSYLKGKWSEDGKNLVAISATKSKLFLNSPLLCPKGCVFDTTVRFSPATGLVNKAYMLGWYQDSGTYVKVIVNQLAGKLTLIQYVNGAIAAKKSIKVTIDPLVDYRMRLVYDGDYPQTYVELLTDNANVYMPVVSVSGGDFGIQMKGDPLYIENAFITPPIN
ncbi:MAG: hypothetical protein C5B54_02240 [Acidobacteria bacterium]|nr:MAG: hypothetical protein C5B54_02240 [Acidobacteriota bacterium]